MREVERVGDVLALKVRWRGCAVEVEPLALVLVLVRC
jgi:hypothetical protein